MSTHYPAADRSVLLSIAFADEPKARIRCAADHAGQSLSSHLRDAIQRSVLEHEQQEAAHLDYLLQTLLKRTNGPRLLAVVGRALTRLPE